MFTNLYTVSHITRAYRPIASASLSMFHKNLTKSADRIDQRLAAARKAEKDHDYQQKMQDQHMAARAASALMQDDELEPGATGYAKLTLRWADHCPWSVLRECYGDLMARPGAGFAFKYLMLEAKKALQEDSKYILEGMAEFLSGKAWERLTVYLDIQDWNRWHKKAEQKQAEDRPADMYRDYGPALQLAADWGIERAKRTYRELALQATMPFSELDNPDWIEPYTGMGVKGYEQIRVRKVEEVSSDGNPIPAYVQSMMEDLGYNTIEGFERMMGCSVSEYHTQFMEAQRSGYNEFVGAELDIENGADDYDSNDKDFEFKEDVEVEPATVKKIQFEFTASIEEFRTAIDQNAEAMQKMWAGWREQRHALSEMLKKMHAVKLYREIMWTQQDQRQEAETQAQHRAFLNSAPAKAFLQATQALLRKYQPHEVMAFLLPFQNTFALWEEDLSRFRIKAEVGSNLAVWYEVFGDAFLDQFSGDQASQRLDEVPLDVLDQMTAELMLNMQTVYHWSEERRQKWNEKRRWTYIDEMGRKRSVTRPVFHVSKDTGLAWSMPFKYQQDVVWNSAYVDAEVMTAIMGEGGTKQMSDAGWDAFRQSLDPEANAEYRRLIAKGKTREVANAAFWGMFRTNQNRIKTITKDGVVLRSGRKVDWGITKLKIEKGEIPMTEADMVHLRDILVKNKIGGYLAQFLTKVIDGARVIEGVMNLMRLIGIEEPDPLDAVLDIQEIVF